MKRLLLAVVVLVGLAATASAQCPDEPALLNYSAGAISVCPCFIVGEEVGVVVNAPASHYPIEIVEIRIFWQSVIGGAPPSQEQALHLYAGALPNPGNPQFSLASPVLIDGTMNAFDITGAAGNKILNSGPFTVTLEFLNASVFPTGGAPVFDTDGCQPGKNVVRAIPGGWNDACALGVTGDWLVEVVYKQVSCPTLTVYCTAGTSATGCQAQISASGAPSATSASGFLLYATTVEGSKDGLYFFGTSGRQANAWGSGTSFQCVVPPVKRAGLLIGSGTIGLCDGSMAQDLNARWTAKPAQNPGAGTVVQAQFWYRDPFNTSNQTTSLSDAIEFTVGP